jgi:hypothetical protein
MIGNQKKEQAILGRKTQRILARLRVRVSGQLIDDTPFKEDSFTIAVNLDGGLLEMNKPVQMGQSLKLFHTMTREEQACIVAHVEAGADGKSSVRVRFLEPNPTFWQVSFPPENWNSRNPDSKFKTAGRV